MIAKTEEVCALLLLALPRGLRVGADGTNHRYEEGDRVPLPVCQQGPSHGDFLPFHSILFLPHCRFGLYSYLGSYLV
ncbi:unnamed protein product [Musa acuminata subsp. burmannicoides]